MRRFASALVAVPVLFGLAAGFALFNVARWLFTGEAPEAIPSCA
jgi:hypothetical protein